MDFVFTILLAFVVVITIYTIILVKNKLISKINRGLLVFIGIEIGDSEKDINWLVNKLLNLSVVAHESIHLEPKRRFPCDARPLVT